MALELIAGDAVALAEPNGARASRGRVALARVAAAPPPRLYILGKSLSLNTLELFSSLRFTLLAAPLVPFLWWSPELFASSLNAIPDVTQVLEMKCLEQSNCLALFNKWVCVGTEAPIKDYSMFEDKVYKITGGLPLAVVLLGGLLYCKDHFKQWDELDDDTLITLWCAEGIFESEDRGEATEEEIAERCYSILVLRGLAQPGIAPFFKPTIHGSVHTKSIARETSFLEYSNNQFDIRNASMVRRLSIHNYVDSQLQIRCSFPKLRTLLGEFAEACSDEPDDPTLRRQGTKLGTLPDSIGDMIHLRYLGLQSCSLKDLPQSIARLLNLETLDIGDNDVGVIVDEFWNGDKLKHVLAKKLSLPGSMGPLRRLMTLHGVISSSLWTQDNCPFSEMKSLLSVEMLDVNETIVEAMLVLENVNIDNLLFLPANLHRLVLRSTCISQEVLDKLCADAIFELELLDNSFRESKLSFQENGFQRLRKLKIGNLEELEELVIGEDALRYLDTLEIFGCPNIVSIQGLDNVYDLDHVVFYEMPAVVAQIKAEDETLFDKIKHLRAIA
ncbi:hypothetical protein HU200_062743 [Digitaria exilis]|uniref:Disease resistance R13L4/SHOC-2-like LRR domain-containing protein n=1 Tax=Digitaria exilis TaxID=1010633 RepID=A0A835DZL7_9POAL|nr:hypothetical protein HU200_062743 [Digitaria exilis]